MEISAREITLARKREKLIPKSETDIKTLIRLRNIAVLQAQECKENTAVDINVLLKNFITAAMFLCDEKKIKDCVSLKGTYALNLPLFTFCFCTCLKQCAEDIKIKARTENNKLIVSLVSDTSFSFFLPLNKTTTAQEAPAPEKLLEPYSNFRLFSESF